MTLGIKAARHQVILFTEADCEPMTANWIRAMVSSYKEKTGIVLGYASYPYQKGWMNKLIAYDNLKFGLQYLSAALLDHPFRVQEKICHIRSLCSLRIKDFIISCS